MELSSNPFIFKADSISTNTRFMKYIVALSLGLIFHCGGMAQSNSTAREVALSPNHIRAIEGDISRGKSVDLPFTTASESDSHRIACFPATDHSHFSGNHLWYRLSLPAHASLDASLYSDGDMSLYAYLVPGSEISLPPDLGAAKACEASHLINNGPGRPEILKMETDSLPCTLVIGVVGANGLKKGSFALNLGLKMTAVPDSEADADRPPKIVALEIKAGEEQTQSGDLSEGKAIPLDWASRAEVACFPGSQHAHFRGRHVFYTLEIPARSELIVKLKSGSNMNLYGLQGYEGSAPPEITRCKLCESTRTDAPGQTVRFTAYDQPEKILLGVAGSSWVRNGAYQVNFRLADRSHSKRTVTDNRPAKIVPVKASRGQRISFTGDIADGKEIPLEWATAAKVNCFPAEQDDHFRGRHVFYTLELPNHAELVVRLRDSRNINLYGIYGYDGKSLPPGITTCNSCESSYSDDSPQVLRFSTTDQSTSILIGVAGLSGILSGEYGLDLHFIDRRPEDLRIDDDKIAKVYAMKTELGKAFATSGDVSAGKRIPLAWAETEGVNCFSASQAEAYRGHHVFYQLEMPAHARLLVKIQSQANVNLYALSGVDGNALPPAIEQSEGCESAFIAEDGWKRLTVVSGESPRKVLLGVAGARNVTAGAYKMIVQLTAQK